VFRLINIPVISNFYSHIVSYPTPVNLTYAWSFGSLAGICLGIQIITGIFLAMHYVPHIDLAFDSVEHILRDVHYGWLIKHLHANGASFFFVAVYIHMGRSLYFRSYLKPRSLVWVTGVIIFILMMATAFIGYVLPWGQMSLWGATVITNLFTAIPFFGEKIVLWLWGGFSVGNATLNRFFSIHYLLPFIIAIFAVLHIIFLHDAGSNNPLGINFLVDKITFYTYFYLKDVLSLILFITLLSFFIFYSPNYLGHPDNYIKANALVTPAHIVPEWYFLPFYAILRTVPNKLGGVILMVLSLISFFFIGLFPYYYTRSLRFTIFSKVGFFIFVLTVITLGWVGSMPIQSPYNTIGFIATVIFFMYIHLISPGLAILEYALCTRAWILFPEKKNKK